MRGSICPRCSEPHPARGLCPKCTQLRDAARNSRVQQQVYQSSRWRSKPNGARWRTLVRDRFTCRRCGHADPTGRSLIADHAEGLLEILAQGRNPFDIRLLQTLCRRCSGSKDGAGPQKRASRPKAARP